MECSAVHDSVEEMDTFRDLDPDWEIKMEPVDTDEEEIQTDPLSVVEHSKDLNPGGDIKMESVDTVEEMTFYNPLVISTAILDFQTDPLSTDKKVLSHTLNEILNESFSGIDDCHRHGSGIKKARYIGEILYGSSSDIVNFSSNEGELDLPLHCSNESLDCSSELLDCSSESFDCSSESLDYSSELESLFTPPPQHDSNDGGVAKAIDRSKKPQRNKAYFCPFCKKRATHFPRHLTIMHSDKEEVREILKHALGSRERMKLISKIRGKGAIEYNNVITREGSSSSRIQLGRRMTGIPIDTEWYLPCLECGNYYKKRNLQNHYKKCANKVGPSDLLSKCRVHKLGHGISSYAMSEQLKGILGGLNASSNIRRLIEYDPAIVAFGNKLCNANKHITSSKKNLIRRSLKVMALITMFMYEHDEDDLEKQLSVSYYYKHEKFDLFKKAVLDYIGYKEGIFDSASQACAIGRIWFDCAKSLNDLYLDLGLNEEKTKLDEWIRKFNSQYYMELEKPAIAQLVRNRRNKKISIPNDKEVATLCSYLKDLMQRHKRMLSEIFDYTHWAQLSKALLVYLTVFNRKQWGEVQGALLKQYQEGTFKDFADNRSDHLSPRDVEQSKQYSYFLIKGGRSKGASFLMERNEVESMELLLANRQNAKVAEDNDFLFAKEDTYFECKYALREFAKGCQVKRYHLLTVTKLRKHFDLSIRTLNLTRKEMKTVKRFLGHNGKAETLHCKMPVREMAHVATLLHASATMSISVLKDRNLRMINNKKMFATAASSIPFDYPITLSTKSSSGKTSTHHRRLCSSDSSHSEKGEEFVCIKQYRPASTSTAAAKDINESVTANTPPTKIVRKRLPWTSQQTRVIEDNFKSYLDKKQIPPTYIIRQVLSENRQVLQSRTVETIRTHISNMNTGKTNRKKKIKKLYDV